MSQKTAVNETTTTWMLVHNGGKRNDKPRFALVRTDPGSPTDAKVRATIIQKNGAWEIKGLNAFIQVTTLREAIKVLQKRCRVYSVVLEAQKQNLKLIPSV